MHSRRITSTISATRCAYIHKGLTSLINVGLCSKYLSLWPDSYCESGYEVMPVNRRLDQYRV